MLMAEVEYMCLKVAVVWKSSLQYILIYLRISFFTFQRVIYGDLLFSLYSSEAAAVECYSTSCWYHEPKTG